MLSDNATESFQFFSQGGLYDEKKTEANLSFFVLYVFLFSEAHMLNHRN